MSVCLQVLPEGCLDWTLESRSEVISVVQR